MPDTIFMKAQHALAESALRAGCKFLAGYPITPMIEVTEYFVEHAEKYGAQAYTIESEVEGGNMIMGVAATGNRVMAASTGVGISLMSEAISSIALYGLPIVFAHWPRTGPGTGSLALCQGDYFQATKAAGHGDFQLIVLAPSSVQEMVDMTFEAFDLAERLRTPVTLFTDYNVSLSTEAITIPDALDRSEVEKPDWTLDGSRDRPRRVLRSPMPTGGGVSSGMAQVAAEDVAAAFSYSEQVIWGMYERYDEMDARAEEYLTDDADIIVTAFGSVARLTCFVVDKMRADGKKVGMIRPQTIFPFPNQAYTRAAENGTRGVISIECNTGQMVQDVRLALEGQVPVEFYGRPGGSVPTLDEIEAQIDKFRTRLVG